MPEYERTVTLAAVPDAAFRYLADPANLPRYVATMVLAEPLQGDEFHVAAQVQDRHEEGEALLRTNPSERRLDWSGAGDSSYRGWLQVGESEGGSAVTVHLHTDRDEDADEIARALDETMANVEHLLAAD